MKASVVDIASPNAVMPDRLFAGSKVWDEDSVPREAWLVPVDDEVLAELRHIIDELRSRSLPVHLLRPDHFDLTACGSLMVLVREALETGHGLTILDRLPVEEWSPDEIRAVGWMLGSLLSQVVAQTPDGQLFHDVRDEGPGDGRGLSLGLTTTRLDFHQDNSGNLLVPDAVCLLAVQSAPDGGESEYCTLQSVYNALAHDEPQLLERLFEPFFHDRLGFEAPGEPELLWAPALSWDGRRLTGRFSINKITQGYERAGETMSEADRAALLAIPQVIRRRRLSVKHLLEPGQAFFFNNAEGMHHREPFADGTAGHERRHLVRMWFRPTGRPFFDG